MKARNGHGVLAWLSGVDRLADLHARPTQERVDLMKKYYRITAVVTYEVLEESCFLPIAIPFRFDSNGTGITPRMVMPLKQQIYTVRQRG